jgi:hypothetical protein
LRRIYCQCSRIFPEISSYYDPLQAMIKNFDLNCIFSSTLISFASIYCVKGFPTEYRECLFSFSKFLVRFPYKMRNLQEQSTTLNHLSNRDMPFSISSIHLTVQCSLTNKCKSYNWLQGLHRLRKCHRIRVFSINFTKHFQYLLQHLN